MHCCFWPNHCLGKGQKTAIYDTIYDTKKWISKYYQIHETPLMIKLHTHIPVVQSDKDCYLDTQRVAKARCRSWWQFYDTRSFLSWCISVRCTEPVNTFSLFFDFIIQKRSANIKNAHYQCLFIRKIRLMIENRGKLNKGRRGKMGYFLIFSSKS